MPTYARPFRDQVEHRRLSRDLVRVERERVQRSRPEPDSIRHTRHQEQGPDRRLVEQVVEDGEHVHARLLGPAGDALVDGRLLIGEEPEPELPH